MRPQIIEKNGKKEFVVIEYKDFVKVNEALEDYEDLKELRKAKKASKKAKAIPFEQAIKDLKIN